MLNCFRKVKHIRRNGERNTEKLAEILNCGEEAVKANQKIQPPLIPQIQGLEGYKKLQKLSGDSF